MGQYQCSDPISLRCPGSVRDRRVVVQHVSEPGQANLLDEVTPDNCMYEYISISTYLVEARAWHRVTSNDHGPPVIIDAIADRRMGGRMICGGDRDSDGALVKNHA